MRLTDGSSTVDHLLMSDADASNLWWDWCSLDERFGWSVQLSPGSRCSEATGWPSGCWDGWVHWCLYSQASGTRQTPQMKSTHWSPMKEDPVGSKMSWPTCWCWGSGPWDVPTPDLDEMASWNPWECCWRWGQQAPAWSGWEPNSDGSWVFRWCDAKHDQRCRSWWLPMETETDEDDDEHMALHRQCPPRWCSLFWWTSHSWCCRAPWKDWWGLPRGTDPTGCWISKLMFTSCTRWGWWGCSLPLLLWCPLLLPRWRRSCRRFSWCSQMEECDTLSHSQGCCRWWCPRCGSLPLAHSWWCSWEALLMMASHLLMMPQPLLADCPRWPAAPHCRWWRQGCPSEMPQLMELRPSCWRWSWCCWRCSNKKSNWCCWCSNCWCPADDLQDAGGDRWWSTLCCRGGWWHQGFWWQTATKMQAQMREKMWTRWEKR